MHDFGSTVTLWYRVQGVVQGNVPIEAFTDVKNGIMRGALPGARYLGEAARLWSVVDNPVTLQPPHGKRECKRHYVFDANCVLTIQDVFLVEQEFIGEVHHHCEAERSSIFHPF